MLSRTLRQTLLGVAIAALPGLAAAAGSQAGDNGRQPIGADADGPRQAIPNAMTNDGNSYYNYDRRAYYQAPPPAVYPNYQAQYYVPYYHWQYYYAPDPNAYNPYYGYGSEIRYSPWYCEQQPLAERPACRDAMASNYYRR